MHDEEITIDDAVYTVAIQLAKAIVEEHHRLHHAVRRAVPKVHRLSWQGA